MSERPTADIPWSEGEQDQADTYMDELEAENRARMGEAIERRGRIAELEAERDRLRELLSGWISAFDADDWATMDDVSAKTEAALEDTHE